MNFVKGDRVKLSPYGHNTFSHRPKFIPDREGTINTKPREGAKCFAVLWDGNKSHDYFHGDFLEAI